MILYNRWGREADPREELIFSENCYADRWDDVEGSRAQGECTPLRHMTTGRTDHMD